MSLQWTLVATFLYTEIAILMLMMLPISFRLWQKLFKSKLLKFLALYSNFYSMAFFCALVLMFLDSLRQMSKYSEAREHEADHGHLDAELQQSMRLFRAQRNCYISGFSLFLALIIRRLATLMSEQAKLIASSHASIQQAKSATAVAEELMKEKQEHGQGDGIRGNSGQNSTLEEELKMLQEELAVANESLTSTQESIEDMKSRAEETNIEYEKLFAEHEKLKNKYGKICGEKVGRKVE